MRGRKEKDGAHGEMKFNFKVGKKGNGDLVLLVSTDGFEQVTYKDLFTIIKHFYDNEDRIYPSPAKGSRFLMEALMCLRTCSVEKTLIEYKLRIPEKLEDWM